MRIAAFPILLLMLVLSRSSVAQDPLLVIKSGWQPVTQKVQKADLPQSGPARQITPEDTLIQRKNREFRTDHPDNPSDLTPDGRRASIERNEREADAAQLSDVSGFKYAIRVRNEAAKDVKVIYWEYRFTERANPSNVVRRQFLCSIDLKKGAETDLSAFSTFGPTNTISAKPVSPSDKTFDELVRVNRIEYGDDDVLQRGDWKLADLKTAIEHATAKPWQKNETCRPL